MFLFRARPLSKSNSASSLLDSSSSDNHNPIQGGRNPIQGHSHASTFHNPNNATLSTQSDPQQKSSSILGSLSTLSLPSLSPSPSSPSSQVDKVDVTSTMSDSSSSPSFPASSSYAAMVSSSSNTSLALPTEANKTTPKKKNSRSKSKVGNPAIKSTPFKPSPLKNDVGSKQNVVVCVRMRPSKQPEDEQIDKHSPIWSYDQETNKIVPTEHHPVIAKRAGSSSIPSTPSMPDLENDASASSSTYQFQFDKLLLGDNHLDDMYDSHLAPVVKAAMEGYNATVFAYGQTGSGKTHTMSGNDQEAGVIPRAVEQVFKTIEDEPDREYLLRVSYLEIYNETLKDLLAPLPPSGGGATHRAVSSRPASPVKGGSSHSAGQSQSTTLRTIEDQKQGRVLITGLREEIVTDTKTVLDLIQKGQEERHVGATDWNERSSRSHCVFQLIIESRSKSEEDAAGKEVRISQLNLIDLAGSERAASQAERRKEGSFINKSLLTLGTVIAKLTEPSASGTPGNANPEQHIPYRDSKLTRILQTSLSGNARIAVICTLSPDLEHANETLSTLKFGKRCKMVVTTAKKGTSMDDKALLQKYRKELDALRAKLDAGLSGGVDDETVQANSLESQQKLAQLHQEKEQAEKDVAEMQKKRSDLKDQVDHLTRLILTSHSVAKEKQQDSFVTGRDGTPRKKMYGAHERRGPRMSDIHSYANVSTGLNATVLDSTSTLSLTGAKPFELEAELAALKKQIKQSVESKQALVTAHDAELAARDAREKELQEAIRLNEAELDEAETAYDKLKEERDEARQVALKEQENVREQKRLWQEEKESNRLLQLVAQSKASEEETESCKEIQTLKQTLSSKEQEVADAKQQLQTVQSQLEEREQELKQAKEKLDDHILREEQAQATQQKLDELLTTLEGKERETDQLTKELASLTLNLEEKENEKSITHEQLEAEKSKREQLESIQQELEGRWQQAQEEVRREREAKLEAEEKLASNLSPTKEDDGVTEEFKQLVEGKLGSEPVDSPALLERERELDEKEHTLEALRQELEKRHAQLKEKEETLKARSVPPQPVAVTAAADAAVKEHENEIKILTFKLTEKETELQALKKVASELEGSRTTELTLELDGARSKIAMLEKQLEEEKVKAKASRPLPSPLVPGASSIGGGNSSSLSDRSPSKSSISSIPTSLLSGPAAALRLRASNVANSSNDSHRGGSLREYKRNHLPSVQDVFGETRATQSTLLSNQGESSNSSSLDKEEIDRLNSVIQTQRAIMSDLEKSVSSWKNRLKTQAELIQKLLATGGGTNTMANITPPMQDGDLPSSLVGLAPSTFGLEDHPSKSRYRLFSDVPSSSSTPPSPSPEKKEVGSNSISSVHFPSPRSRFMSMETTTTTKPSIASGGFSFSSSSSRPSSPGKDSPYYGAHTYNRPPSTIGLGVMPGSPSKGTSAINSNTTTWSSSSSVLPSFSSPTATTPTPSTTVSSPPGSSSFANRRKPRPTIANELLALKASPKVESNKNRYSFDPESPTRNGTKIITNASAYYI